MGTIKRQGIFSVLIAYLGVSIGFITQLILQTEFLSKEEIGLLRVLKSCTDIFVILAQFGVSTMLIRYFPFFKNDRTNHGGILFLAFLIGFLGYGLISLLFTFLRPSIIHFYIEKSPLIVEYLWYILPFALFLMLFKIMVSYSRSLYQIIVPNFIHDILIRLGIAFLIILYGLEFFGFNILVGGYVSLWGMAFLLLIAYYQMKGKLYVRPQKAIFKNPKLKEMLSYSSFVILGDATVIIQSQMDTLMIPWLLNLGDTGIYGIAYVIATIVEMPRRSLNQITVPFVTKAWKENDLATIKKLYQKTALMQLVAGCLFFIGIWCNIDSLFRLIPNGEIYAAGKYVVCFIGLSRVFDMSMGINTEIIVTSKYYRWNVLLVFVVIGFTFISNYLLIPTYGIEGAAFATLLTFIVYNIIRYFFILIKFDMQPLTAKTPFVLLITFGTLGLNYLLPTLANPILDIVYHSIVLGMAFMIPTLWLEVSPDINRMVEQVLRRVYPR